MHNTRGVYGTLKLVLLLFVSFLILEANAEQRKNCAIALPICDTTSFRDTLKGTSFGSGGNDFGAGGPTCTDIIEITPFWYQFIPTVDGPLEMGIFPSDSTEDWEWALFDISAGCGGASWINIACNDSTPNCGPTGISTIEMARDTCNGGSTSPQNWVANVMLTKGNRYALMITGDQVTPPAVGASYEVKFNFNNIAGHPNFGVEANITPQGVTTFCLGDSVQLLSDTTLSYQWLLAGAPIGGATNIDYFAKTSGNYQVEATDVIGCVDTSAIEVVTANALPTASMAPLGPITICSGDSAAITASPSGSGETYQWYRNGVALAGETNVVHQAKLAGNYTVVVTNVAGCPDSTTTAVVVNVNPKPNASIAPLGPLFICTGDSIALTASPNGGGESYQWYLNGGVLAGETNVIYQAKSTGNYTLVVTSVLGCPDSLSTPVVLTVNAVPTAAINPLGPATICSGDSVALTASPNGGGESYQWYLNGGMLAGETNVVHQAKLAGNYTVVVTTVAGCSDSLSTAVVVNVNPSPTASIAPLGPFTICGGDSVLLTASPNGSGETYQWYLNGGVLAGETNFTHQAKSSGNYTVIVTTAAGCPDSLSTPVVLTVNPTPTASIAPLGPLNICSGDSIALTASPSGGGETYQWYLNGGILAGETNMVHQAKLTGNYTVVVTTALGCPDSTTTAVTLTVNAFPTASIAPLGPLNICSGDSILLTASPNGSGETYQWYLNGGALAGEINFTHQAKVAGNYTVIVTNVAGCSDSLSTAVNLTVNANPVAVVAPLGPDTICNGDSMAYTSNPATFYQWYRDGILLPADTNQVIQAKITGNYTIVVTNGSGCSDSLSTPISLLVVSSVATITPVGPTTVCLGDSVELVANNSQSYQWLLNGAVIPGATDSNYFAKVAGNYQVAIIFNTCPDTSAIEVIGVDGPNSKPVAIDDTVAFCEDDSVVINVQINDSDADFLDVLTTTIISPPTNGTATVINGDSVKYVPNVNFFGQDTFIYIVCDSNLPSLCDPIGNLCDTATVFIDVQSVSDKPIANIDIDTTCAGATAIVIDVQANDLDVDGDTLNTSILVGPTNGVALVLSGDSISYTPNVGFTGVDTIVYSICDSTIPTGCNVNAKLCDTTMVFVTVFAINSGAPVFAATDNTSMCEDDTVIIDVQVNDVNPSGLPLLTSIIVSPDNGQATVLNNDSVVYVPNPNYYGRDTIVYQICNLVTACDTISTPVCDIGLIFIDVNRINEAQVAVSDTIALCEADTAYILPMLNDSNIDNDTLIMSIILPAPSSGTVLQIGNDTLRYIANAGFSGNDTIYYQTVDTNAVTACNPNGSFIDTGMIIIVVDGINRAPLARDTSTSTCMNTSVIINISTLISEPDGDSIILFALLDTSTGVVGIINKDSIVYDPKINYTGLDSIQIVVCDFAPAACGVGTLCDTFLLSANVFFDAATCDTGGNGPGNPLVIPNGISPNNDGVNDALVISNLGDYSVVDVQIFNRWGNKVYVNEDYQNDWLGTSKNGGDLPDGTYFYIIKTFEPAETIYKGYIQIHR